MSEEKGEEINLGKTVENTPVDVMVQNEERPINEELSLVAPKNIYQKEVPSQTVSFIIILSKSIGTFKKKNTRTFTKY